MENKLKETIKWFIRRPKQRRIVTILMCVILPAMAILLPKIISKSLSIIIYFGIGYLFCSIGILLFQTEECIDKNRLIYIVLSDNGSLRMFVYLLVLVFLQRLKINTIFEMLFLVIVIFIASTVVVSKITEYFKRKLK